MLGSDGPSASANIQAGKTNTQALVNNAAPEIVVRPNARVDTVDQSQTTNNELPSWVWIMFTVLFLVGWLTDRPQTMWSKLRKRK